jgi:histidinol-phosphatase
MAAAVRKEVAAVNEPLPEKLLAELLILAVDAAKSASELILTGFRSPRLACERKADGSVVTRFDVEAERTIRAFIDRHQPHDWPVLGEELGGETRSARYRWVIDPIDGTLLFSRGLPTFGTLLALEDQHEERSLLGVIHFPALEETYWASRGAGAWCGSEPLGVAPSRPLEDCLVSLPVERFCATERFATADRTESALPKLRSFADCHAHAMVARGALDALAECHLARWDLAASEVIVREAGGVAQVSDVPGTPGRYDIVLGSPHAAAAVAQLVGL